MTDTTCAYCFKSLDPNGAPRCPMCHAAHHTDCWNDNGGCAALGCTAAPASNAPRPVAVESPGFPEPSQQTDVEALLASPRNKRLDADYRKLMSAFAGHETVRVTAVGGYPPERYQVIYNIPGLRLDEQGRIVRVNQHVVDLYLPTGYPREKPYATTMAPVFHPNFGASICLADYWSPTQSVVDIVVQVADMLQYRLYNIHSPLNAVAANWAAENRHQLPISNVDVMPAETPIELS